MGPCDQEGNTPTPINIQYLNEGIFVNTTRYNKQKESNGKGVLPAVRNRNDSGTVLSDLEEHGHGQVEMGSRWVAPSAIVARESIVGRAEVGSSNENRRATGVTPSRLVGTLNFEAGATAQTVTEQGRAESCSLHTIPLTVQISITTSPTCKEIRDLVQRMRE